MSLVAWFPLNGNFNNQGTDGNSFSSSFTTSSLGKVTANCLNINSTKTTSISLPSLRGKKMMTVSFWFKGDTSKTTTRWADVLTFNTSKNGGAGVGSRIEFNNAYTGEGALKFFSNNHWTDDGGSVAADFTSDWNHICFVFTETKIITYVNGVNKGSINKASGSEDVVLTDYFSIGDTGSYGYLNDIKIYDEALSLKQIKELAKGLCLHYSFDNFVNKNLVSRVDSDIYPSGYNYDPSISTKVADSYVIPAYTAVFDGYYCGKKILRWAGSNNTTVSGPFFNTRTVLGITALEIGKTYTISIYMKADKKTSISASGLAEGQTLVSESSSTEVGTDWTLVKVTFIAKSSEFNTCLYTAANATADLPYIYAAGYKIEEGTICTNRLFSTNTISDSSGYGNTGSYVAEKISVDKDTTLGDNSISCNKSGIYTPMNITFNQYTLSCWFKLGKLNTMPIGSNVSDSSINSDFYCYGDNSWKYKTSAGNQEYYYPHNGGDVSTYSWVHFVAVYDGTQTKIYRNGVFEGSQEVTTAGATVNFGNISVGIGYTATSYHDVQKIADFRLYATALTGEDIVSLYKDKLIIDNYNNLHCPITKEPQLTCPEIASKKGITKATKISEINLSDYEELEYIMFNGSSSIDTTIKSNAVWKFDIQFILNNTRQLMGNDTGWGITAAGQYETAIQSWGIPAGNRDIIIDDWGYSESGVSKRYVNGVLAYRGDTSALSGTYKIGALSGGYHCTCKLFGVSCFASDGKKFKYVPVRKKSDGRLGLYQAISGAFLPATGLTAGPVKNGNLKMFTGYKLLDSAIFKGVHEIDTETKFIPETDEIEITFRATKLDQDGFLIASNWVGGTHFGIYYYNNITTGNGNGYLDIYIQNSANESQFELKSIPVDLKQHTVLFKDKTFYVDGKWYQKATKACSNPTTYNLFIGSHNGNYYFSGLIKDCKIWRNKKLIRHFVPVKTSATNVVGMLDTVNNKLYTNTSSSVNLEEGLMLNEDAVLLKCNSLMEGR